jgi:hypothetical protein
VKVERVVLGAFATGLCRRIFVFPHNAFWKRSTGLRCVTIVFEKPIHLLAVRRVSPLDGRTSFAIISGAEFKGSRETTSTRGELC